MMSLKILFSTLLIGSSATAYEIEAFNDLTLELVMKPRSFEENSLRYFSPEDLQKSLDHLFPIQGNPAMEDRCDVYSFANSSIVGAINPTTGEPVSAAPTGVFVNWLSQCLTHRFKSWVSQIDQSSQEDSKIKQLYGEDVASWLNAHHFDHEILLSQLSSDERTRLKLAIVDHWSRRMIGPPEIIEDLGYVTSYEEFKKTILSGLSDDIDDLLSVARLCVLFIGLRDEFLTY